MLTESTPFFPSIGIGKLNSNTACWKEIVGGGKRGLHFWDTPQLGVGLSYQPARQGDIHLKGTNCTGQDPEFVESFQNRLRVVHS